jgi:aconitate hydratase 2/2-methylisocitrate dehydratase
MRKGASAVSTSTRNFPNRLGIDTRVYLASAELATVAALLGRIPTMAEYLEQVQSLNAKADDVYRYMNFDKIKDFSSVADTVSV